MTWQSFLDRVLASKSDEEILRKFFTHVLGDDPTPRGLILFGHGFGKSLIIEALSSLLGDRKIIEVDHRLGGAFGASALTGSRLGVVKDFLNPSSIFKYKIMRILNNDIFRIERPQEHPVSQKIPINLIFESQFLPSWLHNIERISFSNRKPFRGADIYIPPEIIKWLSNNNQIK